ncbi:putative RNA-directed DNA polymerase from transposon BS, partial [Araneus ventricosus]
LSDPYGSDHLPIQIFFNTKKSSFIVKKKTNWVGIQNQLHQHKISEHEFQSYNDFESFCKNTIFSFSSSYKVHSQANAPWWNSQCSFLLGQKRKYLRLARTYLSQPFWIQYKKLSARLNNLISKRQRQYWNNTCENAGYSGKIYKIIRAIYNRNHHPIENANFIKISNALISDPNTQANLFASHYEQNPIEEFIPFDLSSNEDNYYNNSFSVDEFDYVLQKTPNTSPGRDGITANFIKNLPTSFKSTLLSIYNEIWSTGEIPSEWQIAKILPILKPGRDSKNIQSYRPISLTSVVCKIFERLILNRFINTGIHRKFHPHHAGFLPQKDCNYIHSLVHHKIIQAKNDKKYFILIKLDIASAYDSDWRDGLMYKILQLGIKGNASKWLHNFIQHRKFYVFWRNSASTMRSSFRGIPQGSVLSGFLFITYMMDIFEAIHHKTECFIYADDILLCCSDSNLSSALKYMQFSLNKISQWCDTWKLNIQTEKCEAINFSNFKQMPSSHLKLYDQNIPWTSNIKILGLLFSANLSFKQHFLHLKKATIKRLNALKAIAANSWGARTSHLLQIVNATIRSKLEYGCHVFITSSKSEILTIEILYRTALRFATGLPKWTPIPILLKEAGQISLSLRIRMLAERFFLKNLSLGEISPLFHYLRPLTRRLRLRKPVPLSIRLSEQINKLGMDINFLIPPHPPLQKQEKIRFYLDTHPFQTKIYSNSIVQTLFNEYKNLYWKYKIIIATDASKSNVNCSIASKNFTTGVTKAGSVSKYNSIFTSEALAILIAINNLINDNQHYVLLSDSLSVLKALQCSNIHSKSVIKFLGHEIYKIIGNIQSIEFVWTPGHAGITENEYVDSLARKAPSSLISQWISHEDLLLSMKNYIQEEAKNEWKNSKYYHEFYFLSDNRSQPQIFPSSRKNDVLISRFRTKTYPTSAKLFYIFLQFMQS